MKNYSGIFIVFLCLAVILISGCISQLKLSASVPTPTPATSIPATVIPTIITSQVPTKTPKITATSIVPKKTLLPKADQTDVSKIKFLRYSDKDFSVEYPSTWTVKNSTYTPYYCRNILDKTRSDYTICFQNETKSIGPFYFYDNVNYKKPSRIVTFTSADGVLKFVSFTTDFTDINIGGFRQQPTLEWCKARFDLSYPDLAGRDYIGNYKFSQPPSNTFGVSTYDVRMPKNSQYNLSAYTVKSVTTMQHDIQFAFLTDDENFDKYQNLKEYMLNSITTDR